MASISPQESRCSPLVHAIRAAVWAIGVFLVFAAGLWWWLPAEPSVTLPEGQDFLEFSDDGQTLLTAAKTPNPDEPRVTAYRGPVHLWNASSGVELGRFAEDEPPLHRITLSPDGKVAATQAGSRLTLWDVARGKPLASLDARGEIAFALNRSNDRFFAFSPDSAILAFESPTDPAAPDSPSVVTLWNIAEGKPIAQIQNVARFTPLVFSPDGDTLAVVTPSNGPDPQADPRTVVTLFDVSSMTRRSPFVRPSDRDPRLDLTCLAFSPDGRFLASGTNSRSPAGSGEDAPALITVWDVRASREFQSIHTRQYETVQALRFDKSGTLLAATFGDNSLFNPVTHVLYDISEPLPRQRKELYGRMVADPGMQEVVFDNTSELAAQTLGALSGTGTPTPDDGLATVKRLTLKNDRETELARLDSQVGHLTPLTVSPDGRSVAIRSDLREDNRSTWLLRRLQGNHCIQLYDVANGRLQTWFSSSDDARFAPNGTTLAVLGGPRLRLYTLPPRPPVATTFLIAAIPTALIAVLCWWRRPR